MGEETLLLGNDLSPTFAQFADDDWGVNDCDGNDEGSATMFVGCQSDNGVKNAIFGHSLTSQLFWSHICYLNDTHVYHCGRIWSNWNR